MRKLLANAEKANAGPTDRRTDGPTKVTYRVARTRLKNIFGPLNYGLTGFNRNN